MSKVKNEATVVNKWFKSFMEEMDRNNINPVVMNNIGLRIHNEAIRRCVLILRKEGLSIHKIARVIHMDDKAVAKIVKSLKLFSTCCKKSASKKCVKKCDKDSVEKCSNKSTKTCHKACKK